jgi:antitoxin ParD1/3/4
MGTHVSLGNHYEHFIHQMVENGRYNNASEVVRDGLRMMEERERRSAALDSLLSQSRADAKAGRITPAEQVFDELEAEIRTMPDNSAV